MKFRLIVRTGNHALANTWQRGHRVLENADQRVRLSQIITIDLKLSRGLTTHTLLAAFDDVLLDQLRISLQVLTHLLADIVHREVHQTILHLVHRDVERDDVRTIVTHGSKGIVGIGLTGREVTSLEHLLVDSTPTRHPHGSQFVGNLIGTILTSTNRQLKRDGDTAGILLWEEAGTNLSHHSWQDGEEEEDDDGNRHSATMTDSPVNTLAVPDIEFVQHATHHKVIVPTAEPGLTLLQSEHQRTEHWCESQRRSGRYGHDDTHHPTQLLEEHTGHTRHHGQWEEHTNHGQRRSHDRDGHLIGTMYGRLLRIGTTFDVVGDILQDDDCIIHHITDSDAQTRERNHVE